MLHVQERLSDKEWNTANVYSEMKSCECSKDFLNLSFDTNVKNLKWEFSFRRDIKYKKPLKSPYRDQELLNHWHRTKEIYTIKKYEKLLSSFLRLSVVQKLYHFFKPPNTSKCVGTVRSATYKSMILFQRLHSLHFVFLQVLDTLCLRSLFWRSLDRTIE